MARLQPDQKEQCVITASKHQNLALPSYRHLMSEVDEENCHALAAFACLLTASAFASTTLPGTLLFSRSPHHGEMPEWIFFLRGGFELIFESKEWIEKGPMAQLLRRAQPPIDLSLNPDDIHLAALQPLFNPSGDSDEVDEDLETCQTTWVLLRETFAMPFAPCQTVGVKAAIYIWVDTVPQAFFRLLREKKGEALVLLAYMCVMLKRGACYWYMAGHAENILSSIDDIIEEHFRPWLEWPRQKVQVMDDVM
ncbi:hypothetical protein MMC20_005341 [Loxospora ochrophaea]|nr:hypothetical protein [Loxospora ochrophaea]